MKKYGDDMVKQCAGLPLAIIVLGGILATKHELIKWERVGTKIKLFLKKGNDRVQSVLQLSYEDLPYNLKSCFLYFSQYGEGEEIRTTELKQKWIGEGFASSSMEEEDETMEDIAEEYLNELVRRCMIQVGKRGHTGRVKTCRIHDLMRDLCLSKAEEEGFAHSIKLGAANEGTNFKKVSFRRLCISSSNHKLGESVVSSLGRISPQLRSIRFQDNPDDDQCNAAVLIVKNLKSVRVLEVSSTMWTVMDKSGREQVGNLIHLRLLNLQVSVLPTSIGNLICLQTLNLGRCNSNLKILDSIWRMEQLRHLYLPGDGGVCETGKQQVSHFKDLQTLVNFPPKNFDLKQNLVKFINVRKLVMIKRCQEICNILRSTGMVFNRVESISFSYSTGEVDFEAVTRSFPCLYRLLVAGSINVPEAPNCSPLRLSNLTKLVLRHSFLGESHMRTLGKLRSLKVLFLYDDAFKGEQMIFHENDFPQLHHLLVEELKNLQLWVVHEGGLPSLCCLEIVNCWKLESVPDGSQYLKQLKELKVTSMPYVFRKRLERGGDDWDRVSHVPSISFSYCYGEENDDHASSNILDESISLELLKKTIILSGGPNHPISDNSNMDTSAREMIKICGGVRLAITLLGGVLATKHETEEWESIESVLKEGELKGNDVVTSVLELSYEDLSCNVKPCFLYFGRYVRNEEIKTSEMIQRWIGEGFVITSSMEDVHVGQEYLNELVSGGLIQVGERSHRGRVKTCRMHEFVWHFCVSKAKEEGIASSVKVLSLPRLDESGRKGIGNLVDLTFLKLEGSLLPRSLEKLRILQTLDLERCSHSRIPDSVWGMEQLRHLYLPGRGGVCETNWQQVGHFLNLQTLVNFPPRDFDLQQNLVKFSNVRKLVIIDKVEEMGRILRSQEIVFNRLQSLSLNVYYTYEQVDLEAFNRACPCLYRLIVSGSIVSRCIVVWPSNLTKLVLSRTSIEQIQLGSIAKLQSLKVLFLHRNAFKEEKMVFHKNDFPQLLHLKISYLENLETWVVHKGALSNLLHLEIGGCRKLRCVPEGLEYLKQLKDLKVKEMGYNFRRRLEQGGEDWDRVRHVPSISFSMW